MIEGQPGAGKTTFLRLIATALAHDRLGHTTPEGQPWRQRHLGLDPTRSARVPLFLKLAELAEVLKKNLECGDSRSRLLDLLDRTAGARPLE